MDEDPPSTTTPKSTPPSKLMTVSVMTKFWGAHRVAEAAAELVYRLQSLLTVLLFISTSPAPRHACFGTITIPDTLNRVAFSTAFGLVLTGIGLVMEERITPVRYRDIVPWVPRLKWTACVIGVMLTVGGGIGPMVAVDAGLFGENSCFEGVGGG
ncbi:hypothetical protein HK104_011167 [Borealophlyctis nickersoniae]|nr:hypothetical protein HK104_011167 [Borealophlyctis nickersoniae]